jgi:hypothetical protein
VNCTQEGLVGAAGYAIWLIICFYITLIPYGVVVFLTEMLFDAIRDKDYESLLQQKEQEVLRRRGLASIEDIK